MIDIAWLNQVLADPQRYREGIEALYTFFRQSSAIARVPKAIAEDLVQESVLSTWKRVKHGDTIAQLGYLHTVIRNKLRDHFRQSKRQRLRDEQLAIANTATEAEVTTGDEGSVRDVRAPFDQLVRRAAADRAPHRREELERNCEEVWSLAIGTLRIEDAISAERARTGAKDESDETVRDRLLTRHKRAREALLGALDKLTATGEIPSDQREFYEMVLNKLLRRQNKRRGTSTGQVS